MPYYYNKIDSQRWLDGSIREDLEPDERSVWADFMALAGLTREPRRGYIERSEGIPYQRAALLSRLNIPEDLYDRTVNKCSEEGRLQVFPDGTMLITNWHNYNDTTSYEERKRKQKLSTEKGRETKARNESTTEAILHALAKLNQGLAKIKWEVTDDGKLLNKETGEVKELKDVKAGEK